MKNKNNHFNLILAQTLVLLLGFFLYPQIAYFSNLNDESIITLTNAEREKLNLPTVSSNQFLSQAAYLKAEAIFSSQNFSHTIDNQTFSHWVKLTGYEYDIIGENLAIDFISSEGAIKAWLNSTTHRENILNPRFSEIGVAIKEGIINGQKSIIVVQIFGAPRLSISPQKIMDQTPIYQTEPVINQERKPFYINYKVRPLIDNFINTNLKNSRLYSQLPLGNSNNINRLFYVNYYLISVLLLNIFIVGIFIIKQNIK